MALERTLRKLYLKCFNVIISFFLYVHSVSERDLHQVLQYLGTCVLLSGMIFIQLCDLQPLLGDSIVVFLRDVWLWSCNFVVLLSLHVNVT